MRKNILYAALMLILALALLAGCGSNEKGSSALDGATITINPSGSTVNLAPTAPLQIHTQYYTIRVADSSGNPLNNVKLSIYFPWAVPDSAGLVQLYDKNVPVNSPFNAAYTDEFGTYTLRFDYVLGGGANYFGDLEVRTGSAFAKVTFTVTANATQ